MKYFVDEYEILNDPAADFEVLNAKMKNQVCQTMIKMLNARI